MHGNGYKPAQKFIFHSIKAITDELRKFAVINQINHLRKHL